MSALSGKIARVGMTAATPTSSTNQAATLAPGGLNLTINATGRRRWAVEPSNIAVFAGATQVASSDYVIDYPIGRIRFDAARSTAVTYTLDVPWLATSYIGHTKAWTLDVAVAQNDCTAFSTGTDGAAWRTYLPGLTDANVTLSRYVAGGGTGGETTGPIMVDRQMLNSDFYLDLIVNATDQSRYVAYGRIAGIQTSVPVDGVGMEQVTFKPSGEVYWTT
jgi:hypothetical protein